MPRNGIPSQGGTEEATDEQQQDRSEEEFELVAVVDINGGPNDHPIQRQGPMSKERAQEIARERNRVGEVPRNGDRWVVRPHTNPTS